MAVGHPWQDIQQANQRLSAHRENAAREATLHVTYETTGMGEFVPEEPIEFDTPFFQEPSLLAGHNLVRPPDPDHYRLPRVSTGVYRWVRNERKFYIGAFMYYTVDLELLPEPTGNPDIVPIIYHHFAFSGPAYKQMGPDINERAATDDAMTPHRPPVI